MVRPVGALVRALTGQKQSLAKRTQSGHSMKRCMTAPATPTAMAVHPATSFKRSFLVMDCICILPVAQ